MIYTQCNAIGNHTINQTNPASKNCCEPFSLLKTANYPYYFSQFYFFHENLFAFVCSYTSNMCTYAATATNETSIKYKTLIALLKACELSCLCDVTMMMMRGLRMMMIIIVELYKSFLLILSHPISHVSHSLQVKLSNWYKTLIITQTQKRYIRDVCKVSVCVPNSHACYPNIPWRKLSI